MKKTLLAAALAVGFAGVAQAETSVTLYGIVDTGIGYTQFKDKDSDVKSSKTGLYDGVQSGNRWGLKGSEDLGNGLKAIFQLESGFNINGGNSLQGNRLFGRQATLGLSSDSWGTVNFGRQTNIASQFLGGITSPFGDAFKEAHIGSSFRSMATVRADNVVSYVTPNFSGFQFGVGYSFNTGGDQAFDVKNAGSNPDDGNVKLITTGLRYANGPLAIGASYDQLDSENYASKVKAYNVAASYDFEVVKLHLGWGQERKGTLAGFGFDDGATGGIDVGESAGFIADSFKTNNYSVGLSAPVGAGKVMAGWQSSRLASGAYRDAQAKSSQNLYSLGYTYDLSKRTNLYAVGTYGTGYAYQNVRVTQGIVGLRHQF
ncbi:porin [Paracandidimonas soli]|uniref:Putative porin n=1 Tax=Paracandidimonas soli TaxID=1917182 RepID=A0A4R3V6C5_9BURK|nr:porin [Paracandidimonas soli]TCV00587.1 putative porin [Paracandidimonas soli]